MTTKITVDGHDYLVQSQESNIACEERVYVMDVDHKPFASAIVSHDWEQVSVDYEDDDIENTTYPYFEYTTPEELATWIAATSY